MASKPNHFRNEFSDFANREVLATPNVHNWSHPVACEDRFQLLVGQIHKKHASIGGVLTFDPLWQMVRSAMLLSKGTVYIASASLGDAGPYHGWVIGYNAQTLAPASIFNASPTGGLAGIWMAGGGPSADASGNGVDATLVGSPTVAAGQLAECLTLDGATLRRQT